MTEVIEITSLAFASLASDHLAFRCGRRHCRLVGLDGLEPSTSRLSGVRSNHLSYKPILFTHLVLVPTIFFPVWVPALPGGGDDGVRTHDPLLAGQVLSQLSYTPVRVF